MSQNSSVQHRWNWRSEGLITALAVGGFLVVLGLVIAITPDITNNTNLFFSDINSTSYTYGNETINLPAPANPGAHNNFYSAVSNFALGIGILQILILTLRAALHSPIRRTAETVGNLIFWAGTVLLINIFLMSGTLDGWFKFWPMLLVLIGVSLIARFVILITNRQMHR
jgi:hypothetical protein